MQNYKISFIEVVRYKAHAIINASNPDEAENKLDSANWNREEEEDSSFDETTIEITDNVEPEELLIPNNLEERFNKVKKAIKGLENFYEDGYCTQAAINHELDIIKSYIGIGD